MSNVWKALSSVVIGTMAFLVGSDASAETVSIGAGDVVALESALRNASEGDEIVLQSGLYALDHTLTNKPSTTITLRSETGHPEDVVIDGQGKVRCLFLTSRKAPVGNQIEPSDPASATLVRGVTIRNGFTDTQDATCQNTIAGGGLYLSNGIVADCIFEDCLATNGTLPGVEVRGGALFAAGTLVSNSLFRSCRVVSTVGSKATGGAIQSINGGINYGFRPVDCTFIACEAIGNGATSGGGAILLHGKVRVIGNLFSGCSTTGNGGGAYAGDGSFEECRFDSNTATSGGGLFVRDGITIGSVVTNCTFESNQTTASAAAIKSGGVLQIQSCVFRHNECMGNDGGAVLASMKCTARHSLFEDNSAGTTGSAICSGPGYGVVDIRDCIFRQNKIRSSAVGNASGGALSLARWGNDIVERCLFDGNASNLKPDNYYDCGGSAIHIRLALPPTVGAQPTNVVIRNCHFTRNENAPTVIISSAGTEETPDWDNGLGVYLQNCTFSDNQFASDNVNKAGVVFAAASCAKHVFVENCLFLRNAGIIGSTTPTRRIFSTTFLNDYAAQVRNCSSDVKDGFPASGQNANRTDGKRFEHGFVSGWMQADAQDGGDGTWTEKPVGRYGYYVAANNVMPRQRGGAPDIGATEGIRPGIYLSIR